MNKLYHSSLIALAFATATVNAAQQSEVHFFGNVTSVTCDVAVNNGGSMKDVIQLGTVAQNTESTTPVEFSFKPVNPASCTGLNGKTATITWYGDFDANGLKNSTGKAIDAVVKLTATNAQNNAAAQVTASNTSIAFDADKVNTDGFKFQATLKGGATSGDYQGIAVYAVTYN
ncbi:fimbrial protein [Citrobacter rodentium]|uniref:Fimbrial protein n=1 Tax=Citrobacter rodentium (strain ICC168) TaxID=637910 RepID=D2TV38_CITRI|nr:fimbrial protein [Citrobacter rodentium]KIQ48617.1 fimbrial protein [Citrobacter rodentium]CBG91779.1 putative fimbrial protein [Citrobacter rodentium ICC168]HAT8020522.1 fimbrial protein [Citrobacter rodentium]HAT8035122.1 fimbrial protein [Citrobacter rodentium]